MFFSKPAPAATVAFNMRPRKGPYGGGNQWLSQTAAYFKFHGYGVQFHLDDKVDCVLATHAGLNGTLSFSRDDIARARERNPRLRVIHRINDNDQRKGTSQMNPRLQSLAGVSDYQVFISDWLRDHHAALWFDTAQPHGTILNGADSAIFHPIGSPTWKPGQPFRWVTHHWSNNWAKGFDVYREFDAMIADGRLPGFELWVVGRWPEEIRWKAARTFPACSGHELAAILRQCHGYLTASRFEPGGMHFIEGMQCGAPVLFHEDGGGIVELARRHGVGFSGSGLIAGAQEFIRRYPALRAGLLETPPSGDWMCLQYRRLVQQILAESHA